MGSLREEAVKFPSGLDRVAGTPELEARVVIIPDPYDPEEAARLHSEAADSPTRILVYTESQIGSRFEMGLLGDFAPSVAYAINRHHEYRVPYRETRISEFAWSKLCHLHCTLLKALMFGYVTAESAASKVRGLRSVAGLLKRPDLFLDDEEITPETAERVTRQVLLRSCQLLGEVQLPDKLEYVTKQAAPHELEYVSKLVELFGDNLVSVLLYGSSAQGEGKDFDNLVVLREVNAELIDRLRGVVLQEQGKEVGIIIIPEDQVSKFLYINVSNLLFRKNGRVLYGELSLPIESEDYAIRKEMYHAGVGTSKLVAALNMAYKNPQLLIERPGLFEYFMKLNRFSYHGLSQFDGYTTVDKEQILAVLKERYQFAIPAFVPEAKAIQQAFLAANVCSARLAQRLYSPKKSRDRREVLLTIQARMGSEVGRASLDGRPVLVFRYRDPLNVGDIVPVQILEEQGPEWEEARSRLGALKAEGFKLPERFYLGLILY